MNPSASYLIPWISGIQAEHLDIYASTRMAWTGGFLETLSIGMKIDKKQDRKLIKNKAMKVKKCNG